MPQPDTGDGCSERPARQRNDKQRDLGGCAREGFLNTQRDPSKRADVHAYVETAGEHRVVVGFGDNKEGPEAVFDEHREPREKDRHGTHNPRTLTAHGAVVGGGAGAGGDAAGTAGTAAGVVVPDETGAAG